MKQTKSLSSAQQAMITPNLIGYAEALAQGYSYCGVEMDDLKQEACYGLCQAALHFDPERGASFKTFATYYIKKYILKAIKDYGSSMRIPRKARQEYKMLSLDVELTRGETKIRPDGEDGTLDDMEHGLLEEFIAEDARLDGGVDNADIDRLLSCLNDMERKVIDSLFGLTDDPITVNKTAKKLMLTPKRVLQIYNKAINKLEVNAMKVL